eukprot:ANDGO_06944.mRNA.1 hypothetical protein
MVEFANGRKRFSQCSRRFLLVALGVCVLVSSCSILTVGFPSWWRLSAQTSSVPDSTFSDTMFVVECSLLGPLSVYSNATASVYFECSQISKTLFVNSVFRTDICEPFMNSARQIALICSLMGHVLLVFHGLLFLAEFAIGPRQFSRVALYLALVLAVSGCVLSVLAAILYAVYIPSLSDFKNFFRTYLQSADNQGSYSNYTYLSTPAFGFIFYITFTCVSVAFALASIFCIVSSRRRLRKRRVEKGGVGGATTGGAAGDHDNNNNNDDDDDDDDEDEVKEGGAKGSGSAKGQLKVFTNFGRSPVRVADSFRSVQSFIQPNPLAQQLHSQQSQSHALGSPSPRSKPSSSQLMQGPSAAAFPESYYWSTLMAKKEAPSPTRIKDDIERKAHLSPMKAITFEPSSTASRGHRTAASSEPLVAHDIS